MKKPEISWHCPFKARTKLEKFMLRHGWTHLVFSYSGGFLPGKKTSAVFQYFIPVKDA
jgi:hypothetical protein